MKVNVAVVQDSPVFFDKEKTIDKVGELVKKYTSGKKIDLILFPETFIPGYPRGFSFGTNVGKRTLEGRELYGEYYQNSVDLESDDLKKLESTAKENNVYLFIGVTEKQSINGSLYCSVLYISPEKGLVAVHRKIKPTGAERVIWAEAGGESLITLDTKIGRIGGLICWENYMPLARMALYSQGVQIYLAPTADSRDSWVDTMKHIALEGRCFVLGSNQYFTKSMYPEKYQHLVAEEKEDMCRGGSIIVSPLGKVIAGPLFNEVGVLYAELDMDEIPMSKLDFDVIGHYTRKDIFNFSVNGQPEPIKG
ncbi:MAG: carbon-nitrogen hydrolase family protein [Chitinophagaceae bacterium]|nr:carbon-nitrogen hydrolase family protein [Chitinophagaceae bacterium]